MVSEERQEQVLNLIILGMSLPKSCYVVECSDDEIEWMQNDETFQRKMSCEKARLERDLLISHDRARAIAEQKGNTKPTEWRLRILDPEKYGGGSGNLGEDVLNPKDFGTTGVSSNGR